MLELTLDNSNQSGKLTASDRRNARLWQLVPWVELFAVTVSPPLALFLAYLITGATSPALLVLAALSLPFSLITGLIVAIVIILFRRRWLRKLRDRLASDGITADEVGYFIPELTGGERRVLREMEKRQPLLADAYRETFALRLNATRLTASARPDLLGVERRNNRARYLNAPDTAVLMGEPRRGRQG